MTAARIHPEDLIDRAKHGALRTDQERLLKTHLDTCAACRFELSLTPALYQSIELGARDQAVIARAIANVSRAPQEWRADLGRRTASALTLLLSLLAGVALAAGGAYLWQRHSPPPDDELPQQTTPTTPAPTAPTALAR